MKRLLNIILALLGFGASGCVGVAMYGTPHVDFHLTARVVDSDGNPIQGIEARTKEGNYLDSNTVISDYQGNIDAVGQIWPGSQYAVTFYDIDGAYPIINRDFVKNELSRYKWINREEDMGSEGLRKAKNSYYPDFMIKKYTAVLKKEDK